MSEKITIKKIGRKDMPSKFKEGETYKMTTILDDKSRKMSAFGAWAEGWNVGDEVEVDIKEKSWKDKDGFEQINLNLDNPNKKPFTPRGGGNFNPLISAYNSAAMFAIALAVSGSKKKLTLADLDKIAEHIKSKFDSTTTTTEKKEGVPEVDVEKEQKTNSKKDEDFDDDDEEDEDPF